MDIKCIKVGQVSTNCYIVSDEKKKDCLIIDPGDDAENIIDCINEYKLVPKMIFITHGHFDHICAADVLRKKYNINIVIHEKGKNVLPDPLLNVSSMFLESSISINADRFFEDGDTISIGDTIFNIIYIGGHSIDSACLYNENDNILFSGDTLFYGSIGRCDTPYGDQDMLIKNIKEKLFTLPGNAAVYPGHGRNTTIENEKLTNMYLKE